jgi:hypothetical protein
MHSKNSLKKQLKSLGVPVKGNLVKKSDIRKILKAQVATAEGYSGYKNYETFQVSLWIDNDQGLYEIQQEMAQNHMNNYDTKEEALEEAHKLGDSLQTWVEDMKPTDLTGVFETLLDAALGEVHWPELAEVALVDLSPEKDEDAV